ncbi:transcriptional regulator [Janthinobacterium sp. CG_23.3]|uniref:FMN-binding negative transcriptional regulator n=1 Tax=unclassified Janthinobacterium TaxID=2610881 RepID=UPI000346E371|nr:MULTISPECIES: FMN-binding negative transcriptional regulator [unclassified Janthinobacterium]MEC5159190.1 transcriptional regulator [Janthinobacterium sp. CG_S6]
MYQPALFEESRLDVLHALIDAHPLGAVVTHGAAGLGADHIPFEVGAPTAEAPFGVLRGHVARANPLWRHEADTLVLFQGAQAYITPAWYEEKARTGKVVPTYNYAVVHGYGRLRAIDDPQWLLAMLERLTARHEAAQAAPWRVDDAPPDFIAKTLAAIVGIEIPLTRIEGKWKTSQNRSARDKRSIAAGLGADHPMAPLVRPAM